MRSLNVVSDTTFSKFHQEQSPEGGPMEQHHLLIWSFREKGRAFVIGPQ